MRDQWFERAGWAKAHLLRSDTGLETTLCSRAAPGGWSESTFSAEPCGQCVARRRARPDARVRQYLSVVDVHLPEGA
jgi:hypothetical protein